MKNPVLIPIFILQLAALLIGTMFKIMHWPDGEVIIISSYIFNFLLVLFIIIEIARSTKKPHIVKAIWIAGYSVVLLMCSPLVFLSDYTSPENPFRYLMYLFILNLFAGFVYLFFGRSAFYPKQREIDKIEFDSF
jgi:hypothetical protein